MALKKNPKYDLKAKYSRILEICMISSLTFLIAAFKLFPAIESGNQLVKDSQELVNMEDIIITKRDVLPPPPPKPPIPIEAPTNEPMEDITLETTDNLDAEVIGPPPPPPKDTKEEAFEYFVAVEQQPEPIGGIAAILAKLKYPEIAKRAGVQGKVHVKAYVDENGVVQKVELVKGIGAGCDEEALKAVKNTPFSPGKQRGKPVKVMVTVPIRFVLK